MPRPSPRSSLLARALAVAGIIGVPLVAQASAPSPDPLRVLRAMEVDGETPFPRDRIAGRLAVDAAALRALQREVDAEAAAAVAERVADLHRRAGYVDATATGAAPDGVLRVALTTGPLCRRGPVQASGNTVLDSAELRERLANDSDRGAVWNQGDPFAADDTTLARAETVVHDAYAGLGRHGVKVAATTARDGDTFVLQLAIRDEGREVRVQSVRLDGEAPEHAAAVLAELAIEPGALATKEWLAKLQRRVETTGRYFAASIDLPDSPPAVLDPLVVTVTPRPGVPAPGKVRLRDADQLQRAIDDVVARLRAGSFVRTTITTKVAHSRGVFTMAPGEHRLAVGSDGFSFACASLRTVEDELGACAIRVVGDQLAVAIGGKSAAWRFGSPLGIQLQGGASFGPSGDAELRWGLGVSTRVGGMFGLRVHPGIAAHALSRADEVRRDGEELQIRFGGTTVRIGGDGIFQPDPIEIPVAENVVRLELVRGSLAAEPPALARGQGAAVDAGGWLLAALGLGVDAMLDARIADHATARVLVGTAAEEARKWARPAGDAKSGSSPAMPPLPGDAVLLELASFPAVHRSMHGRAVDASLSLAALVRGDVAKANASLRALLADPATGPLWLGALAGVQDLLGNDRAATAIRDLGKERWSFDAMYVDAADVMQNLPALHGLALRIGARWRAAPELQEAMAGVGDGETGDLAAWRTGLQLLWDAGGADALRKLLLGE